MLQERLSWVRSFSMMATPLESRTTIAVASALPDAQAVAATVAAASRIERGTTCLVFIGASLGARVTTGAA
jgi:hypothetical protein